MTLNLKPCPFCGSDDIALVDDAVECLQCHASSGILPDPVTAWNKRVFDAIPDLYDVSRFSRQCRYHMTRHEMETFIHILTNYTEKVIKS